MKRLLAILLTTVLMLSVISTDAFVLNVNAETSGTTGNCTWKKDGTVLTISGRGTMNDYGLGGSNLPWGTSITKVIISWGVTNIGAYAFSGCNRLTCIEIPNSVTSIGHDAFRNCTDLTSINIPNSVENIGNYAFYGCKGLTSIKFPACVTGIGDYAFSDCTGLTSINIPASGANMGAYAFYGCKGLTSINISGRLMNIKEGAFCACTGLTSIKLPVSVTKIGSDAFRSCTSLCDIWYTGEDRIGISIGTGNACLTEATWHYNTCVDEHTYFVECDSTCNNCDWIRSVSVEQHSPESIFDTETHWKECLICKEMVVTPIEHNYDNACDTVCDCGYTRSITHNYLSRYDSINHWEECSVCHTKQNIEEHTYSNNCDTTCNGCVNIREVSDHAYGEDHICDECGGTVPSGTTGDCKWLIKDKILTISGNGRMGDYTSSAPYMKYDFDKVVIGDGVTSIGDSAFQGCSGLTNIEIPNSVTSIGWYAFSGCSNLISIEIPKGVISISGYMFYDCSSLTRITLSATYIAGWAFYGCSRLAEVRYQGSKTALIVSERGNDALTTAVWSFNTSDVVSSGTTGNCEWSIEGRTLTISGNGRMGDYTSSAPYMKYDFDKVVIGDGVSSIGNSAFQGCSSLTSIDISDSVTDIGACAFKNCTSLVEVNIPSGVVSIGDDAFFNCNNLLNIIIPDTIDSIGDWTFYGCSSLSDVWYAGDEEDKTSVLLGSFNTSLKSAIWHYSTCIDNQHSYGGVCDGTCNTCEWIREVSYIHNYDNTYNDNTHYEECIVCSDRINIVVHEYDNACDTSCDCGYERTITHNYSQQYDTSSHWDGCSVCHCKQNIEQHIFDNNCDTTCDCGYVRTITHNHQPSYDTQYHYLKCTVCGDKIKYECHVFENDCDTTCGCGYVRTITHNYLQQFNSTSHWDECSVCHDKQNIEQHTYINACDTTCDECGNIRDVPDHVYGDDYICDECGHENYILGDLDGDSELTDWDGVMLARYLAGWQVEVVTLEALDIDNDGEITDWDGVILDRYLAGWNIQIGGE